MSNKRRDIIGSVMRNHNIVILISVVLMIVGVIALIKMPRNEFPQFTIRHAVIVGVYPGATSAEVEAQLTRVVENYIFSHKEIKKSKTYSYSKEGIMYIFVELNDNVKNSDLFWSKLKLGLSELKMQLPSGVIALIANSDFGDTSALLITLSSDTKSYKELEEELKKLEAECRKIPATSKMKHFGLQKEKIYVNVKPEMLNEYNIKSLSLLGSYQLNGMVNYAGVLKDGEYNLAVHLPQNFESEKDLSDQIVYSDLKGNVVRLKNIATIERRYADPDNYIKQNGKKAILLSLEMQTGNNIVAYGKQVDKAIATFEKNCPADIKIAKISELPKYVNDSVSNFMKEFLIAIIAVILVTMLLLPLRVASVAGITVPISVLLTLSILYFFGVELHTVSLASLILVLGMIVDNSIVIIDNHVEKIDSGISAWHAAIKSAKELFVPIVTATLAILAAYIPLGYMVPGTAGEFLDTIPIVVGVSLTVSIIVAIFLVPYLNFVFIKKGLNNRGKEGNGKSILNWLQNWFDSSLEKAFHHPKLIIGSCVILVAISFILLKNTDQQLFPEMERNQFAVEVYLPTGSSLENTAKVVDSLENVLLQDKRVTNVTSFIGISSPRFHVTYAPNMPSPNYGQLLINTISDKATREVVNDYKVKYADNFANAHIKWKVLALQLNKASIEVRISSDSIKDIRTVEKQVDSILKKTGHIAWIRTDWDQKQQSIKVKLDRDKANRMGYSKGFVSTSLMVGLDGIPLTTIWENDYPVEVRLTQENTVKKNIKIVEDQYITSPATFTAIPLRSFAKFSPEWTEGNIVHRNGTRTMTILVDNDSKTVAAKIFDEIRPQIDHLKLPEMTSISYGGDYEGQVEVFTPMTIALALSILLIFFILLFQFKKVKLSLLIMSTMLLTLPGAAIGLKLMGYPFSITAFVGISSLCGMVVRNGIILIDYARKLFETSKMSLREASIAAGKRRMRPIFLTSAAASVGVIPMILSRSPLWGPLGTVICFGLLISMVLTLYFLPILYSLVYTEKVRKSPAKKIAGNDLLKPVAISIVLLIGCSQLVHAQNTYSLEQCKKLASANNVLMKNGNIEIEASKQVKKAAFTKYFPDISATGMTIKFNEPLLKYKLPGGNLPVYNGDPATLPFATEFAYFPGFSISMMDKLSTGLVSATQPVFAGGRIYYGNQLAGLGINVSTQKLNMSDYEVRIKTEELYWLIVSLNQKMNTINAYNKFLDTLYKDVNNAYKAGLINHNDVLKVSLKQTELRLNKLKLENGKKLASMSLCQHIGIPYDSLMVLSDSVFDISDPRSSFANYDQALQNRPEYQLMQQSVKAEKLQTKMKRGEYLPEIGVGAGAFTYDMSNTWNNNMMIYGSVSIPISAWWEASHTLKEGKFKEQISQNNADNTGQLLKLQMEKTWTDLQEAYQQINLAEDAIRQTEENLKIVNDNYKAGVVGISDLLEAQALLQTSNDNLTEARCSFKLKMAKYLQATANYK
jgi:multidrug efflux pump subunit AcrB/outer membrane protein TolC